MARIPSWIAIESIAEEPAFTPEMDLIAHQESNEVDQLIDQGADIKTDLDAINTLTDKVNEVDEVSQPTADIVVIAAESYCKRWGVKFNVATESYSDGRSRKRNLLVALEAAEETLWQRIKRYLAELIERIRKFFRSLFGKGKGVSNSAEKAKREINLAPDSAFDGSTKEVPPMASLRAPNANDYANVSKQNMKKAFAEQEEREMEELRKRNARPTEAEIADVHEITSGAIGCRGLVKYVSDFMDYGINVITNLNNVSSLDDIDRLPNDFKAVDDILEQIQNISAPIYTRVDMSWSTMISKRYANNGYKRINYVIGHCAVILVQSTKQLYPSPLVVDSVVGQQPQSMMRVEVARETLGSAAGALSHLGVTMDMLADVMGKKMDQLNAAIDRFNPDEARARIANGPNASNVDIIFNICSEFVRSWTTGIANINRAVLSMLDMYRVYLNGALSLAN